MDVDEKRVDGISSHVTHAVQGDATNEATLKDLGIGDFKIVVVAMGSTIENSVLSTLLLKKLGVRYVIARAVSDLHGDILQKIGADQVVFPQRDMGRRAAHGVLLIDVLDYMSVTQRYGISRVRALPYFVGKNLGELGFGRKGERGVAVLLIQREKEIIVAPAEKEIVRFDDVLVVGADDENLASLLSVAKRK